MDDYVHFVNSERTWIYLFAFVVRKRNIFRGTRSIVTFKNERSWRKTSNSYIQKYPEFGCWFPFITLSYFGPYGYQNGSAILLLNPLLPLLPLPLLLRYTHPKSYDSQTCICYDALYKILNSICTSRSRNHFLLLVFLCKQCAKMSRVDFLGAVAMITLIHPSLPGN